MKPYCDIYNLSKDDLDSECESCSRNPCEILRVSVSRVRAIPDLLLKFDGERNGWVIGGSFRTKDGSNFEFKEVLFIHQGVLKDEPQ